MMNECVNAYAAIKIQSISSDKSKKVCKKKNLSLVARFRPSVDSFYGIVSCQQSPSNPDNPICTILVKDTFILTVEKTTENSV